MLVILNKLVAKPCGACAALMVLLFVLQRF
jgi:hypothetical protein